MLSFHVVTGAPGTNDAAAARLDAFLDSRRRTAGWTRIVSHNAGAWRHMGMVANPGIAFSHRKAWKADVEGCKNKKMRSPLVMPNFFDAPTPASSVALIDESAPLVGRGAPVENAGRKELNF